MRRWLVVLMVSLLILTGCESAAPAVPTATALPPTETPTPGPTPYIPPTPTPGLPLGGRLIVPDEPFESALLVERPADFTFDGERLDVFTASVMPQ